MRRKLILLAAMVTLGVLTTASPATAGPALPYASHPRGHSVSEWLREVGQFYLGDASNPLLGGLEGDCGELIDGVFFLVAPIDVGVDLRCEVPTGTPLVVAPAGFFTTEGIDGDTDAELEAAAAAGFVTTSDQVSLDGRTLRLQTVETGAYDVISEPGSFYDTVVGVGTGPVRTDLRGNLLFLHPLPPGEHVIQADVTFADGATYSVTYHLLVAPRGATAARK